MWHLQSKAVENEWNNKRDAEAVMHFKIASQLLVLSALRSEMKALIILVTFCVAEITTTPFRIIASEYKLL